MFIKSIILATIFLCEVRWIYCGKATVPYQVCKRYLDYKFTYKLKFTVDESQFKDANFTLSLIRQVLKPDSECNNSIIDLSVKRTLHRGQDEVVANYRVFIEIKKEKQLNSSVLTLSTGEKIDECYEELSKRGGFRVAPDRDKRYALNISGVEILPFYRADPSSERECQNEIVYCPTGSEEVNKSCECSKGTHLNANHTTCTKCSKDTYQEQTGMFNCIPCQNGYTTLNKTGSSNRTACKPVILPTTPTPTKNTTKRGSHSLPLVNSFSSPTPTQTTTKQPPICNKGEYFNNGSCIPCPKNTYMNIGEHTNTSCVPCPNGQVTSATGAIDIHWCVVPKRPVSGADDSNALAIALPICLLVVVAIAGILFFYLWRKKKREQEERNRKIISARFKVVENPRYVTPDNSSDEETTEKQCTTLGHLAEDVERRNLEIPRDCITMTRVRLGRGNFGEVKQVIVRKSNETEMLCAAKMARGANSYVSLQDMLEELEIHLKLEANHENVVNLIGVCSGNDGPFYLIMEYCGNGSLIQYLRKHDEVPLYVNIENSGALSLEWKMSRTLEICNGMKYLASHKIVHRDLAARNVLLDCNTVAKIADFGMAKDVYLKSYYKQQREASFPLRWMAIDSLQTFEFTEKTDVWSFGVLVWEIFTDGKLPYYDIIDDQKVAHYILNGKKLKRPEKCPKFLYNIMLKCWSNKRYNRPKFWELYDILNENIHPEKHGNPLKRRLSRNVLNTLAQTKSSLKRKMSRKGSNHSRQSVDSTDRRKGSRKYSQSSFDRIINEFELQRLKENQNAMDNEGFDEETEAEVNSLPKKKREDENQNVNSVVRDFENDIHSEKITQSPLRESLDKTRCHDSENNSGKKIKASSSSKIPQHSTNNEFSRDNIGNSATQQSSTSKIKTTNNDACVSSDHEDSKKALPDRDNNYAEAEAILNVEKMGKNGLSTGIRPQTADSTAKYGSYEGTTDLDDLTDGASETSDNILARVPENLPNILAHNSNLPEKELNPHGNVNGVKTFDDSIEKGEINLTTGLDNNSSDDDVGETLTAAKKTNTLSQNGVSSERRNNGSLVKNSNHDEDETDYTANEEELDVGSNDGVEELANLSDKAESEDGLQNSSDGGDFLNDVLNAMNAFQSDDNDIVRKKNETDDEENPNSSSC